MTEGSPADVFWVAGCLVFVIEGLMLAAMPASWQKMMNQLATMEPARLRWIGVAAMLTGLLGIRLLMR